jgi:hypothetical protein
MGMPAQQTEWTAELARALPDVIDGVPMTRGPKCSKRWSSGSRRKACHPYGSFSPTCLNPDSWLDEALSAGEVWRDVCLLFRLQRLHVARRLG